MSSNGNSNSTFKDYESQVSVAYEDLLNYSDNDIEKLAIQMGVNPVKPKEKKCKIIAQKLIYANSEKIPMGGRVCKRYNSELSPEQITEKRELIYNEFSQFANAVTEMTPKDLMDLFKMYDSTFYNSDISDYIKDVNYSLTFKNNGDGTFMTEGKCANEICEYVITIPVDKFKNVKDLTIVAGDSCKDQLECLLRVMEHEISHLIIFMFCGDYTVSDQHGKLFMNMVKNQFGHTDHRHWIF